MLQQIQPSPTQNELVYATLRGAIVDGTLAPGVEVIVSTVAAQETLRHHRRNGAERAIAALRAQRAAAEGAFSASPPDRLTGARARGRR